MRRNKKFDFAKEFREAMDRILAGEKAEPHPAMPDDYQEAIDFACKMIELKVTPRPSFKAQLKNSLVSKLSEMEQERARRNRFQERLKHLIPQRPLWRTVAASLVVIAVAGGVIWGTGILTKPLVSPRLAPAMPPDRILEVKAAPTETVYPTGAKIAYLLGEEVEIELKFKNVSSEPITITPFHPKVQITRSRPYEVVRSLPAGSREINLQPGETVVCTIHWNQQDDDGQQVTPGWYYVDVRDVAITKATAPTTSQVSFASTTKVLVQYPQGALGKTIEVNESQTVSGVTITLERAELSWDGAKFYAFTPIKLAGEDVHLSLLKMIPILAQCTVDGSTKDAGPAAERLLDQGTELIWDNLDPVPSDAKELTFTITEFGDWQGPWEFHIPLQ